MGPSALASRPVCRSLGRETARRPWEPASRREWRSGRRRNPGTGRPGRWRQRDV